MAKLTEQEHRARIIDLVRSMCSYHGSSMKAASEEARSYSKAHMAEFYVRSAESEARDAEVELVEWQDTLAYVEKNLSKPGKL